MEPLDAVLTGRILGAQGRPWPGLKVMVFASGRRDETYPPEFHWGYSAWQKLGLHSTTTDGGGRFRVAELMPGLQYLLWAKEKDATPGPPFAYTDNDLILTIDPGKTKDLGDLKSKRASEK